MRTALGLWLLCSLLGVSTSCDTKTHKLLQSKCNAADGGGACGAPAEPIACKDHAECPPGELCKGTCQPCTSDCGSCPPGTVATKTEVVNQCVLCSCAPTQCKLDSECPSGSLCAKGICLECAKVSGVCPSDCPWDFKAQPIKRNGCVPCECQPFNQCTQDADCPAGLRCYAGQRCQDGCKDPSCCFGNICSLPGCSESAALSCAIVGCAQGTCLGKCDAKPVCKCSGQDWDCAGDACDDAMCIWQ